MLEILLALCRRFEGLRLQPYLCSAGVPSIGYGATFYESGRSVTLKDPDITKERAEQLLLWHINNVFLPQVIRLCPQLDTPDRIAAITDFAFNLGTGNLKTSTLRRKIAAEDWEAVPEQLLRWDRAAGVRLKGLTLRRMAEAALIQPD